jgi:uncharacterized membrane-anchored protein YhcB (DUF1043 family)
MSPSHLFWYGVAAGYVVGLLVGTFVVPLLTRVLKEASTDANPHT